jgi:hypothetical protein
MASVALQRSKEYLEHLGWHVDVTERWIMGANIRKDFLGLADLAAVRHDFVGTWYINACEDNGAVAEHVKAYLNGGVRQSGKMKGQPFPPNPHLPVLLCHNRFSIFGWGKRGDRGKRKTWTLRVLEAYLDGPEVKFKEVTPEPVEVL